MNGILMVCTSFFILILSVSCETAKIPVLNPQNQQSDIGSLSPDQTTTTPLSIQNFFVPNANKIIAHRGAWKNTGVPENSIASLRQAIKLGCFGSEFDVHMSLDSVLYICHDDAIQGFIIEKTTSATLSKVKLSNGEPIPTLDMYIEEAMKQYHTKLILEIKPSIITPARGITTTDRVVKLVKAMNAQDWVDYISFDYAICKRIKVLAPNASSFYLNGTVKPEQLATDKIDMNYPFSVLQANENWIAVAQQKNIKINSWTVDNKDVMTWLLIAKKIDFITTNEPEIGLAILK